ncbi:MAG TPA: hypothetical protein VEB39_09055 [Sphingomicrobium sp.]|nr:hypothetical protein [Sphingomicrobium sp.]
MNMQPVNELERDNRCLLVRQVEARLDDPAEGAYWRGKARQRICELEMDMMDYGLTAEEELELAQLQQLVGRAIDPAHVLTGLLAFAFVIAFIACIRMVGS